MRKDTPLGGEDVRPLSGQIEDRISKQRTEANVSQIDQPGISASTIEMWVV
jgi:hypothetical protein